MVKELKEGTKSLSDEELQNVSGGRRDEWTCPKCGGHDRFIYGRNIYCSNQDCDWRFEGVAPRP